MTAKRAFLLGLLAWLAYVSLRTLTQRLMPFTDMAGYVRQDIVITALRLSCAAACYGIARRRWSKAELGLGETERASLWSKLAVASLMAAALVSVLSNKVDTWSPMWMRLLETAIALAVALNEEIGFRGLFFNALRDGSSRTAAVCGTTLMFTLMHAGYQEAWHLPRIFLIGLTFALLRDRGLSLRTLILAHFSFDALSALAMNDDTFFGPHHEVSIAFAALAACLAWRGPLRPSPSTPRTPASGLSS
jgi:membrane protease YdiL (CAAX protease family)